MEPKHFAWGIIGITSMYVLSTEYFMQRNLRKIEERQDAIDHHIRRIKVQTTPNPEFEAKLKIGKVEI